ncbi:hypothetical protein HMPREF1871_01188 [Gemelliphila asaccharolytica]|uniref:Uncharacterized protein n=1 Tax=Gemelliphila asaccharolytica TaxID=502393 RepID=A0ABR5TKF6_9BACL|nr:hypothetical protein HMPREF1871_01188 [Gemella asaccharolytica]
MLIIFFFSYFFPPISIFFNENYYHSHCITFVSVKQYTFPRSK